MKSACAIGVAVGLVATGLAGCSSSRGYTAPSGVMTGSTAPPPRPAAGMLRDRPQPYSGTSNLGGQANSQTNGQYRWNGNPERVQLGSTPTNQPPARASVAANGQRSLVVRPGDTLYGLSQQYGVSVAALVQHNNLASPTIQAGQTLVLPPSAR